MTDGGFDFHVERIDLAGLSVDAGRSMGMVIVQPEYDLGPDGAVPFRILGEFRQAQIALIEQAFRIRAAEAQERNVPIPFILFPEAAIPINDPDGLEFLRLQLQQAQGDVIFIGGLEGLSPQEVQQMAASYSPAVDAAKPVFAAGAFVNVCVIAVKSANGGVTWHFQAKLRPSQLEQPRNMARGQRVLYFVAPGVAFFCQICFDHIAADGGESLNIALCKQIIETTQPAAAPLDFVFVPQYNQKPDHPSVRQNTRCLLKYQGRALQNNLATVVAVNRAAAVQGSPEYGRCGFHYAGGRWKKLTSDVGPRGYELYDRDDVTSAVFRKRTPAIHVATRIPPSDNTGESGNPRVPLDNPRSYLITDGCDATPCPCLPGTPCVAGKYVECDCLPCKLHDVLPTDLPAKDEKGRWQGFDADHSHVLRRHYEKLRGELLVLGLSRTRDLMYLLLHMHPSEERNNPDLWSTPQVEAVVELLAALSVLAELQPVDFQTVRHWTARMGESLAVVLIDARGSLFCEQVEDEYKRAFEKEYYRPETRRTPTLIVALRSRGVVEPLVKPSTPEIVMPRDPERLGDVDSFAKPTRPRLYICQGNIFDDARRAQVIAEVLKSRMGAVLE